MLLVLQNFTAQWPENEDYFCPQEDNPMRFTGVRGQKIFFCFQRLRANYLQKPPRISACKSSCNFFFIFYFFFEQKISRNFRRLLLPRFFLKNKQKDLKLLKNTYVIIQAFLILHVIYYKHAKISPKYCKY